MNRIVILFFVLSSLTGQTLHIQSDYPCQLIVNGNQHTELQQNVKISIQLPQGEHQIEAISPDKNVKWQSTVHIDAAADRTIDVPLKRLVLKEEIQKKGYWEDTATRMKWAAADNGAAVSWIQANAYCKKLKIGTLSSWELPEIDELRGIFGGTGDERGFRIIIPLRLTGWAWSTTEGKEPGEYWALDFGDGARASVVSGDSGLNRSLCIHR